MLSVDGVTAGYRRGARVLDDVALRVERGDRVALLGLNGAGKTTLFRVIAGILEPWKGSVRVAGKDPSMSRREALQDVGIMWAHEPGPGEATPRHILRWANGIDGGAAGRVETAIEWAEMGGFADRPIAELSHGQRRRLELSLAVVREPSLLLLDEPTSGMDMVLKRGLWSKLREIDTALVATHDPMEVVAVASDVVVLHEGRVVLDAPLDTLPQSDVEEMMTVLSAWMEKGAGLDAPSSPGTVEFEVRGDDVRS